jgi:hypothetical protein
MHVSLLSAWGWPLAGCSELWLRLHDRYTPIGMWGGLAYGCLPCFARVFYWYHWFGDVVAGATVSFVASQLVLHINGGAEAMSGCTWPVLVQQALPAFAAYLVLLKVLAKVLRPPPAAAEKVSTE